MTAIEKSKMSVLAEISENTPKHDKQGSPSIQIFSKRIIPRKRGESSRNLKAEDFPDEDSSKRFFRDAIQKYFSKLKPKKTGNKSRFFNEFWNPSPASSPTVTFFSKEKQGRNIPAGIKGAGKLGKSRSTSATASPITQRNDLLLRCGWSSAVRRRTRSKTELSGSSKRFCFQKHEED